jgi:hypothetical protein
VGHKGKLQGILIDKINAQLLHREVFDHKIYQVRSFLHDPVVDNSFSNSDFAAKYDHQLSKLENIERGTNQGLQEIGDHAKEAAVKSTQNLFKCNSDPGLTKIKASEQIRITPRRSQSPCCIFDCT